MFSHCLISFKALLSNDPYLFELMSKAFAKTNKPVQAHLHQAHYYQILQDYASALTQIRLARKITSKSPREAKQIEARAKEIQNLISKQPIDH